MKYKNLNLKYAAINCFYFMLVCGIGGYANNYLGYKGFSTGTIGIILTMISVIALLGQTVMAPIVDRSKSLNEKKFILITLAVSAAMLTLMLFLPNGSFLILVCVVIGFAFATMGMPFLNSIAFIYEKEGQKINYGLGRGVGSASYAVAGQALGLLISCNNESVIPFWALIMAALTAAAVFTLQVPSKEKEMELVKDEDRVSDNKTSYAAFFKKYSDITLVVVAMVLLFFCHMIVNNYMINIISTIGGDASSQGTSIMIQALVEMPPMFLFAWLLKKFKVDNLMLCAAVFYSIKHLIILFAPNMTVFYFAMVLQMLSYAILIPGSVYFADKYVAAEDRNQGQTVMAVTITVAGLFASFLGGFMISGLGIHTTLLIGTVISIAGTVLMVYAIMKLKKSGKVQNAE